MSSSTWTISGSGTIANSADQFHFVWQSLSGDGSAGLRVVSHSGAPGDQEGIMLRQSSDPGAPYYYFYATPYAGINIYYRTTQGSNAVAVGGAPAMPFNRGLPIYLGIGRAGNTFTAYTSSDGSTWAPINGSSVTINMSSTVLAGMAVASGGAGLNVATFDTVSVSTSAFTPMPNSCPSAWSCADIGLVWPGTQAQSGATYTVQGAGLIVPGYGADQFHFVWQSLSGDGSAGLRVVSHSGAPGDQEGIMLRQSSDPSAPYYYFYATPYAGINIDYRTSQGAGAVGLTQFSQNVPAFPQVGRVGNTFTAYTSSDGHTWTAVSGSSVTINMGSTVLAGMAVASGGAGLNVATFDTVNIIPHPSSGTIPWHPQHSVRFSDHLSANVDLFDGHLDLSAADLNLPALGPDLTVQHVWDSVLAQVNVTSTAGQGWLSDLTPSMGGVLTQTVSYTDVSGAVWVFPYVGSLTATAPYTAYQTPPGLPWQLTTSSDGYTLTNILNSDVLAFDSQGHYLSQTDAYSNSNVLSYGPSGPISEANSGGRTLALTYTNGLLSEAASPLWQASGGTQGQHVTYRYSGTQLTTQTLGAGTTDALTSTFGYSGTQLVSVTTPFTQATHTWTITYDPYGRVSSIVSPISGTAGQAGYTPALTTSFSYTPGQTQVVEGAGSSAPLTTTYTLDAAGEPITVTDGLGDATSYTYDADHDVLTSTDANNNTTTNTYQYVGSTNNVGLVTQTVKPPIAPFAFGNDPLALTPITLTYTYDPQTHDLTETHNVNSDATTLYVYDSHHSVITTTELLSDSSGGCFSAPARRAGPYRRPLVDARGRLIGLSCTPTYVWRASVNTYDPYGERVSSIDGRGLSVPTTHDFNPVPTLNTSGIYGTGTLTATYATHSYTYTMAGDLAQEWTPPIVTTLGGVTTTAPVTTSYGYDLDGNRTSLLTANNFGSGNATTYGYDHIGRLISTTMPPVLLYTGVVSSPVEMTSYDGDGNVVQQVDGNGDVTTSSYDPLDRRVATTDPVSGTSLITYTATDKVAAQDPHGYVTRDSYDGAGRLLLETDPLSGTTQYQYDPVGNTVAITGGTASAATQIETRQYDALNEVITDTLLASSQPPSTTATSYDTDGNVVFTQQPNGDQTGAAYDRADQLLQTWVLPLSGPAGPYENYSYDNAGNQTEYDDMDSRVHQAAYDGDNRTIQSTDSYAGTSTLTTTMGFDPDGNIISQVETSVVGHSTRTHSTTNSFNVVDWRVGSTDTPASGAPLPTTYGYDGAGQERTETVIDGLTPVTTTLDAAGRTTAMAEGYGSSGPYTTSYGYDPNDLPVSATLTGSIQDNWGYDQNNRLSSSSLVGPTGVVTPLNSQYGYGYNALGWTTAVTTTLNGVGSTQTITHDALGRMTGESGSGSTQSWSYDGNGNLLTSVNNGATTSYAYNSLVPNELQSATLGGVTTYYTYDQSGDTTSITTTSTISTGLSYDSQARLSVVTLQDGTTVTMSYNALGQRASYTVSKGGAISLSEAFTYRGDALAQAVISATQKYTDTYIYDPSGAPLELLRQYQNGTTGRYWYVLDGRGNVVALTGVNGNVVDSYSYDLWGKLLGATEAVPQRLRYAGYWYDVELGWYWVSVREYAPGVKRWLQPDQSEIDGVRTYVYVGDDPIDLTDPSGLGSCNGSHDLFSWVGDVACHVGNVVGGAAHGVYQFVAGDDLATINSEHASGVDKFLAVVDLSSNALSIIPIFGEGVEAVRLAVKGVAKLASKEVVHEISYEEAKAIARRLLRRGAKDAAEACAHCFPAGTLVATVAGLAPIQSLHVGQRVLAENTATGQVAPEPVHAVIQDPVSPLIAVELSDGSAITVTADHPFWVDAGAWLASPGWLPAGQLRMGDHLRTANGLGVLVVGLHTGAGHAAVYTLTVAKDHTYFVGNARVLVHNSAACDAIYAALRDGQSLPINEALQAAIDYLGPSYKELSPGRYVSADGLRQVRLGDSDILGLHGGGPHMNFEKLGPNLRKIGNHWC